MVGWEQFLDFAKASDLQLPAYVFATLVGMKGLRPTDRRAEGGDSSEARKNTVVLPGVVVEADGLAMPPEQLFRRLFDVAANAFGLSGCPRYRSDGTYVRNAQAARRSSF
jgi:hypothetical protein